MQDFKYGRILRYTQDAYIGDSLGLYGEYALNEMALLQQLIKPNDTVIEVGANIGSLTIPIAQICKEGSGRVYAFEPQRITFQMLCGNVVLNNLFNVWTFNQGGGSKPGKIKISDGLYKGENKDPDYISGNNGNFQLKNNPGEYEIDIITLDGLNLKCCDLIKIDAEGMEPEILDGAWNLIKQSKPIISMEGNYTDGGKIAVKKLQSMGYTVYLAHLNLFGKANYFETKRNIFLEYGKFYKDINGEIKQELNNIISNNWLCVPKERNIKVNMPIIRIEGEKFMAT